MYHPTKYWHKLEDGRVQCDVCPRACKMHEGQRGLCFVRGVEDGEVRLYTYGRSSGFCVDPIEKKPLNHFLPGTSVLSFGTAGCNLACKFCFHPDTLVATPDGMRRIAELFEECANKTASDHGQIAYPDAVHVWTRIGKQARVAKVFSHHHSGSLVSLKASSCPRILLTANHKVFATRRSSPDIIERVEAGKLSTDHFLVVPKRHAAANDVRLDVVSILANVECKAHAPRNRRFALADLTAALQSTGTSAELGAALGYHPAYVRTLRSRFARGILKCESERPVQLRVQAGRVKFFAERSLGVPQQLELNRDLAWLLGFYCAEGSIGQHLNRPNSYQLIFSCGRHELALVERAAELLGNVFGLPAVIVNRRTTITVEVRSTSLARLFEALCGRGAKGKRVPPQLMQASQEIIRAFLQGYFVGDGYFAPDHVVGNTVSQLLALGLFELGLHLDLLPTFFVHENPPTYRIEGREVSQSTTFIVKFARHRYEQRERGFPERTIWRDAGDKFLVPVKHIETIAYEGPVYNLEVDDPDHSYLAPFLAVGNCQNSDISKSREMDTLADRATPQMLASTAKRLGCASVAYTYNDPVVFMEYAIDVADACRELGVRSVAVTAGYMYAQPRAEFYRHMDAANVDLKGFTERFYRKICGGELAAVLETLEYLRHETRVWFEITTLLIPDENDSNDELEQMTRWIADKLGCDVPLHFTAFHPDWKMMDKSRTPAATLTRAREIALKNGLHYVYTGNVHDSTGSSTYCASCGSRVIERDWYELGEWRLDEQGRCLHCAAQLPGVFKGAPGTWGARRLPVRIAV